MLCWDCSSLCVGTLQEHRGCSAFGEGDNESGDNVETMDMVLNEAGAKKCNVLLMRA